MSVGMRRPKTEETSGGQDKDGGRERTEAVEVEVEAIERDDDKTRKAWAGACWRLTKRSLASESRIDGSRIGAS